jgi:hypothetical protein
VSTEADRLAGGVASPDDGLSDLSRDASAGHCVSCERVLKDAGTAHRPHGSQRFPSALSLYTDGELAKAIVDLLDSTDYAYVVVPGAASCFQHA